LKPSRGYVASNNEVRRREGEEVKKERKADCLVIFVRCNGRCYQVLLTKDMENSIFNILSQMFYPNKIQVNAKEFDGLLLKKKEEL
jgi:hypothetical protein